MIRYRHDPDNPEKPIIETTPKDIDHFRGFVLKYLSRKFPRMGRDAIEDIAQITLITTWRAVSECRLRGSYAHEPKSTLRKWLTEVGWRVGMNMRLSAPYRASLRSVSAERYDGPDGQPLPDMVIDARRMLGILTGKTRLVSVQAILLLADGATQEEVAAFIGVSPAALSTRLKRIRKRLTVIRDHGPWQEPPQPPPRSPRNRKRKR